MALTIALAQCGGVIDGGTCTTARALEVLQDATVHAMAYTLHGVKVGDSAGMQVVDHELTKPRRRNRPGHGHGGIDVERPQHTTENVVSSLTTRLEAIATAPTSLAEWKTYVSAEGLRHGAPKAYSQVNVKSALGAAAHKPYGKVLMLQMLKDGDGSRATENDAIAGPSAALTATFEITHRRTDSRCRRLAGRRSCVTAAEISTWRG